MFSHFGFLDLGTPELIIILAIVLLLFGGKKLPEVSKSLGESMRELRKGISGDLSVGGKQTDQTKIESKSNPAKE